MSGGPNPDASGAKLRTLADRVGWLVATVRPPGRGPYQP